MSHKRSDLSNAQPRTEPRRSCAVRGRGGLRCERGGLTRGLSPERAIELRQALAVLRRQRSTSVPAQCAGDAVCGAIKSAKITGSYIVSLKPRQLLKCASAEWHGLYGDRNNSAPLRTWASCSATNAAFSRKRAAPTWLSFYLFVFLSDRPP